MRQYLLDWAFPRLFYRAVERPYEHLGGYMNRFWLLGGSYRDKRTEAERGWRGSRLDRWIGRWLCVRLHHVLRSNNDRHLHDHPSWSISLVLSGGYWEILPYHQSQHPVGDAAFARRVWRGPGALVFRRANHRHRLVVTPGNEPWTLFILGPRRAEDWGFYTPTGKVPHRQYLGTEAPRDYAAPYPDENWRD